MDTKQKINNVRFAAHGIAAYYNGENDIIPGAPRVLYTEMQLLEMVKSLCDVLDEMKKQIDVLRYKLGGYK